MKRAYRLFWIVTVLFITMIAFVDIKGDSTAVADKLLFTFSFFALCWGIVEIQTV
jgi:hypothetical protein